MKIKSGWAVSLDLSNFPDNYPAVLFSGERFFNEYFGILLEVGPVVAPENYDETSSFLSYFGFKSRTEFKLYYHYNHRKKLRDFISMDAGYHGDWYKMMYDISYGDYFRIEKGKFQRSIIDFHLRWGRQRFLLPSEKLVLEWSFGLGLQNLIFNEPDTNGAFFTSQTDITSVTDIEPLSFNVRVKLGYVFGK